MERVCSAGGLPNFTGMSHSPLARAACQEPELSLVAPRTLARCHHGCRGRIPTRGIHRLALDARPLRPCHGLAAVNVIEITGCRVRVCGASTASWLAAWRRGPRSAPEHNYFARASLTRFLALSMRVGGVEASTSDVETGATVDSACALGLLKTRRCSVSLHSEQM